MAMSTPTVDDLSQQVERLSPEDKLSLLAVLVENLRRQVRPQQRKLSAYYGLGAGQGFETVQEVDTLIKEERAGWEHRSGGPATAST